MSEENNTVNMQENSSNERQIDKNEPTAQHPVERELLYFNSYLHDELFKLNSQLGDIYMGAVCVLNDNKNPDAIPQAAHSLREIIKHLPNHSDIFQEETSNNLMNESNELEKAYNELKQTELIPDGNRSVKSSENLNKYLRKSKDFFEWKNLNRPGFRNQFNSLATKNVNYREMPRYILERIFIKWREFRSHFNSILHHNKKKQNKDEFITIKNDFEKFVLNILRPAPSEDLQELDKILEELNK